MKKGFDVRHAAKFFRVGPWLRLLFLCVITGIVAGLGALAFDRGLNLVETFLLDNWLFKMDEHSRYWMLALVPAAGGALAGLLAWWLAPEAGGHGTDAVIKAFHRNRGEIRGRIPIVKGICSILSIGTGGSAGKEGPIAQIGAGFGSTLARMLNLSIPDRRILMIAGVAGGIGAIFKAPLGGALFAAEVLYRDPDFEHDAIIPSVISSVMAYSVFTAIDTHARILEFTNPLTGLPVLPTFPSVEGNTLPELLHYAVLSLLCAAVAYVFVKVLHVVEHRMFNPLPLPLARISKPALGGIALGLLAISLMFTVGAISSPNLELGGSRPEHIMAGGHHYLQTVVDSALNPASDTFWTSFKLAGFLGVVVLAKIFATAFTIGSGGSGGLLFPALFLGGVTGAAYAKLLRALTSLGWMPQCLALSPNERVSMILVGMGGVFAACTKTPIASLVMVSEITGSYGLVVPLMLTCASAYLLSYSFSINEEQVPGIADSPAHRGEFLVNVLEDMKVSDALPPGAKPELIPADMPFPKVLRKIRSSAASVFPIVDAERRLVGLFSITDLRQIMHEQAVSPLLVAGDLGSSDFEAVHLDTTLDAALRIFTARNAEALPVVAGSTPDESPKSVRRAEIVGMLHRRDLIAAYHRRLHDIQSAEARESKPGSGYFDGAFTLEPELPEAEDSIASKAPLLPETPQSDATPS